MLIQEEKQREIRSSGHFLVDSASLAIESHNSHQYTKEEWIELTQELRIRTASLKGMKERNPICSVTIARSLTFN